MIEFIKGRRYLKVSDTPPLAGLAKSGSNPFLIFLFFFFMRIEKKDGITIIHLSKAEKDQWQRKTAGVMMTRDVDCQLTNNCRWLYDWCKEQEKTWRYGKKQD